MINLRLVTGFLGAGKTTWLERQLRDLPGAVNELIVNDFAGEGLDEVTLREATRGIGIHVESVVGGCACCDKLGELHAALFRVVGRHHRRGGDDTRLVIETSGLAEPHRLVRMLTDDPVLRLNIALRELTVVLDGVTGKRLLRHRAAIRAQVGLADRVVLTRSDLADPAELIALAGDVRGLNSAARIVTAEHGAETVLDHVPAVPLSEVDDVGIGMAVRSWTTTLRQGTSWPEYALWLHAVCRARPEGVLRSKGVVPTVDGSLLVQSMGSDIALPVPADPDWKSVV